MEYIINCQRIRRFLIFFYKWHDVRDRELFNAVRHCTLTGADYLNLLLCFEQNVICVLHAALCCGYFWA